MAKTTAKTWKKLATSAVALVFSCGTVMGLVGCGEKTTEPPTTEPTPQGPTYKYTLHSYTSATPSTWNELDATGADSDQIMNYLSSAFFSYDYDFGGQDKFKADGTVNKEAIVPGSFTVRYDAATALEDVTAQYGEEWGYTEDQIEEGSYIWKITLREDLKWNDGTPIEAADFVYTMEQQLDPTYRLGRADTYYENAVKLRNARNYFYQGRSLWSEAASSYKTSDLAKGEDGVYLVGGNKVVIALKEALSWLGGDTLDTYVNTYGDVYFDAAAYQQLLALADADGRVPVTDESWDLLTQVTTARADWGETRADTINYMLYYYEYGKVDFSKVGIFAPSKYEIVLVCDNPMEFFKEDGTLSYLAAYNFAGLPLVKKDLYEACRQAPQSGSDLCTTTYNTSLETTASWGPFMLDSFQTERQFVLTRNENWYGYDLPESKGLYQTDRIVTDVIEKVESAWMAFLSGQVDEVGIDVTHAADYRNSAYAYYTPATGRFFINLYSNLPVLNQNGRNNSVLAIPEFRKALSLGLDRADMTSTLSTANQPMLGVCGPAYYDDVENGSVYRNTEQAQKGLLRAYGYTENADGTWTDGVTTYSFEDAYDSMTGYNPTQAKELLIKAYEILTADPTVYNYDDSKQITILLGDTTDDETSRRAQNYIQKWLDNLSAGTPFEGKFYVDFTAAYPDINAWADAFQEGEYDINTGGFQGAPFDPFYMISTELGNLNSSLAYHIYWDTSSETLTKTMPEGDYAGAGETLTLTIADWYNSLNGNMSSGCSYNWAKGKAPSEVRLEILAMLEETALQKYYSLPWASQCSASMHGAKWDYITYEYNTMMGYGGLEYMTYNYTDEEWDAFVASQGGDLTNLYKAS